MIVVNQATNAWVSGIHVPIGSIDFPVQGRLQVFATGWGPSNVVCASADTLFLYEEGYTLQQGYGFAEAWVLGFSIAFAGFGLIGIVRRLGRGLHAPDAMDNI